MTKKAILKKLPLVVFIGTLVFVMGEACSEKGSTAELPAASPLPAATETHSPYGDDTAAQLDFTEIETQPAEPAETDPANAVDEPVVVSLTLCSEVIDRSPADSLDSFDISAGRVFTHTAMSSSKPDTIYHVYKFEGTEIARVPLYVGISPRWRTWSSKWLTAAWVGPWTVEIQSGTGRVLSEKTFTVRAAPEKEDGNSAADDGVASTK